MGRKYRVTYTRSHSKYETHGFLDVIAPNKKEAIALVKAKYDSLDAELLIRGYSYSYARKTSGAFMPMHCQAERLPDDAELKCSRAY